MTDKPWMRTFLIDGQERDDTTYRTPLVEHYTEIKGRTFLDLGTGDGCEARAIAMQGAKSAVAVEGKASMFAVAKSAQDYLRLPNHEVRQLDVRRIDTYGLGTYDVVTCFGLLYHMTNPFNVLKRIRHVTGELLLLETHVAPRTARELLHKHQISLPGSLSWIELDGVPFEGMVVRHVGDFSLTKGSLDSPWTFWMTAESLIKALTKARFQILDYQYELDGTCPEPIRKWGELVGLGRANTKVWIAAVPKPGNPEKIGEPTERALGRNPFARETVAQSLKRRTMRAYGHFIPVLHRIKQGVTSLGRK